MLKRHHYILNRNGANIDCWIVWPFGLPCCSKSHRFPIGGFPSSYRCSVMPPLRLSSLFFIVLASLSTIRRKTRAVTKTARSRTPTAAMATPFPSSSNICRCSQVFRRTLRPNRSWFGMGTWERKIKPTAIFAQRASCFLRSIHTASCSCCYDNTLLPRLLPQDTQPSFLFVLSSSWVSSTLSYMRNGTCCGDGDYFSRTRGVRSHNWCTLRRASSGLSLGTTGILIAAFVVALYSRSRKTSLLPMALMALLGSALWTTGEGRGRKRQTSETKGCRSQRKKKNCARSMKER